MRNIGILSNGAYDSGTTYYLNNSAAVAYSGSGTPWDTFATSPFQLGANSVTGALWTPQASPPPEAWSRWYDLPDVTESLPLQWRATSVDNAITLLERLQNAVFVRNYTHPPLFFQEVPGNTATRRYAWIKDAKLQEGPQFLNVEHIGDAVMVRAVLTITRTPFFAKGSLTTLYSGSIGNTPLSNTMSPSVTPDRPLTGIGLPISLTLPSSSASAATLGSSTGAWARIYVASASAVRSTTLNSTISTSSSYTLRSGTYSLPTRAGTKLRFLAKTSGATSGMTARVIVYLGTGGDGTLYTSPYYPCSGSTLVDFGGYQLPEGFTAYASGTNQYTVEVQFSTNGGTLKYIEVLEYYTFGWFDAYRIASSGNQKYEILCARTQTLGSTSVPRLERRPHTVTRDGSSVMVGTGLWRGEPPVAIATEALWLAWGEDSSGATLAAGPPEPYQLAHSDTETVSGATLQGVMLYPTFFTTGNG